MKLFLSGDGRAWWDAALYRSYLFCIANLGFVQPTWEWVHDELPSLGTLS